MEEINKPGPWPISLKWGIIAGALSVLIVVLTSLNIDWEDYKSYKEASTSPLRLISTILIMIAAIIIAQIQHRKNELGGFMRYGRSVGVATIVGMGMGICMALYLYIQSGIWHPEFQQTNVEGSLEILDQMGIKYNDADIERYRMAAKPGMQALVGFFSQSFSALVIGLITSIFIQKSEQ